MVRRRRLIRTGSGVMGQIHVAIVAIVFLGAVKNAELRGENTYVPAFSDRMGVKSNENLSSGLCLPELAGLRNLFVTCLRQLSINYFPPQTSSTQGALFCAL